MEYGPRLFMKLKIMKPEKSSRVLLWPTASRDAATVASPAAHPKNPNTCMRMRPILSTRRMATPMPKTSSRSRKAAPLVASLLCG